MPTTYSDQFFIIDAFDPPPGGTALTVNNYNLIDQNDDGLLGTANGDSVNGSDITATYPGDTLTVNMGGSVVTITGVTFYLADGSRVFTPTDGTVLANATFISSTWVNGDDTVPVGDLGPACFAAGTLIATQSGERKIESLEVGDLVRTMDNGLQEIRWIGCSKVCATGRFAPVVFKPGAIGNDVELRVSPQHRMLVQGWQAELYFGCTEILVPAKHLVNRNDITQVPAQSIAYYHILFDRHEVITSNGAQSESFFPGDQVLLQDTALRDELIELFPELTSSGAFGTKKTARMTIKGREAGVLRHVA